MIRRLRLFARTAPIVTEEERQALIKYVRGIRLLLEDERAAASRFRLIMAQSKDCRSAEIRERWVLPAARYFREHVRDLAGRFWEFPIPAFAEVIRASWGKYYSVLVACFVTASDAMEGAKRGLPYETWMADEHEFSKLGRAYAKAYKDAWRKTLRLARRLEIDRDELTA